MKLSRLRVESLWAMATLSIMVLLSWTFFAAPASAAPGQSCYGQVAYNVEGQDYGDTTQRGIQAKVWGASTYFCLRVSSMQVNGPHDGENNDRQFVEWGWILGWGCDGNYHTNPTLFYTWNNWNGGSYHCAVTTQTVVASGSSYRLLRLSDINGNTVWGGYTESTTEQWSKDLDFSYGRSLINGERDNTGDIADAHFSAITEYHDSNGWSNYDNLVTRYDNDPGFKFVRVSANEGRVSAG